MSGQHHAGRAYRMRLDGTECAVVEWGNPEGKPIIALHGWLDNAATFSSLASYLDSYRIIAPEMPGHGQSEHLSSSAHYHFIDGIGIIYSLAQRLGLDKFIYLGHSMGAALGSLFAGCFPEKVSHLISIEALGPLISQEKDAPKLMAKAVTERFREFRPKRVFRTLEDAITARARVGDLEPSLLTDLVTRALTPVADGYIWSSDPRLRLPALMRMSEAQMASVLSAVTSPVLLVTGDQGMLSDRTLLGMRKGYFREIEQIEFNGGHHIHLQHPMEIAQTIRCFIESQQASGC